MEDGEKNANQNQPVVEMLTKENQERMTSFKRVAAYCRVSTELEEQKSSLETQMASYYNMIAAHPDWQLAGIYADRESGTGTARRTEFNRLMADAEDGKIDVILVKSVQRFARNTVDTLNYTRRLKELNVTVYFERDHINTRMASSELILTVMAALAQEESHALSENLKWGIRKRFAAGMPKWSLTYGYCKLDDGRWAIVEDQATVIRWIYEKYLMGNSLQAIAKELMERNIAAPGKKGWYPHTVSGILQNEKYVGDVLMQKTYTTNHLTHERVRNDQKIVPQYYARNHHPAIISQEQFEMVKMTLAMKDSRRGSIQYPYYGFLCCPICGEKMVRFRLNSHGFHPVWVCGGTKENHVGCAPYHIEEKYIDRIILQAIQEMNRGRNWNNGKNREAEEYLIQWLKFDRSMENFPISYAFLKQCIEKITFRRSQAGAVLWNEAVVVWRVGVRTCVFLSYEKVSETPGVQVFKRDGAYYANECRIANGKQIQQHIMNNESSVRSLHIWEPPADDPIRIPYVLSQESKKGIHHDYSKNRKPK